MKMPVYRVDIISITKTDWDVKIVMGDERVFVARCTDETLIKTVLSSEDKDIQAIACLHLAFKVIQQAIENRCPGCKGTGFDQVPEFDKKGEVIKPAEWCPICFGAGTKDAFANHQTILQ
jgi:hypothetical protein